MPLHVDPRAVLAVLAKLAPAAVMTAAENFLASRERVAAQRFNAEREAEELANVTAAALDGLRVGEVDALASIDAACVAALERYDADRTARAVERRSLRDVVDVDELKTSDDPRELLRLVGDAEVLGGEVVGAEARALAIRRLKTLAAAEKNQLSGRAFVALCELSSRQRGVERADVVGRHEQQKRALRLVVAEVATAIGLGEEYRRATVRAAAAPPPQQPQSTRRFTVGRFWDEHPEYLGK